MRFIALLASAVSTVSGSVAPPTCQSICQGLEECANDPHAHGSYCKDWQSPQVCFGLFFTDASRSGICFQPNNEDCPEGIPVECPPQPTCEERCEALDSCRNDPHAHGSYCKVDHDPQTCFGMYYTEASRTEICYQPNEGESGSCPEDIPVLC